jgi:hypothetical protein
MKRISVKGYKAINKEKKLDLAPINLLIGPNGSGKSTLINSLVLSKGMFNVENSNINNETKSKSNDILNREIFPKFNYAYKFADRLINPFDSIGKFSSKEVNSNKKNKEFSFMLPIELSYFPDKFDIELKYYLNENNNALLNGIRIINLTNDKDLFSLQSANLEENARKKDNKQNQKVFFTFDSVLKIDVDYLISFLKELKNNNPDYPGAPFDINEFFANYDSSSEEHGIAMEEYNRSQQEFLKKLREDFHKAERCNLFDTRNETNESSQSLQLLDWYNQVENQAFFDYYSTDANPIEQGKVDIKKNEKLYAYTVELENQWLLTLKTGIKGKWSGNNVASIMDLFDRANSNIIFEEIISTNPEKQVSQKLNLFNVRRSTSKKTDIIFNQLLVKNIFNAIYKLNSEINDLIYIPPNRVKNYKSLNSYLDEDVTTTFIKRLNKIQYQDKYGLPIEHFINYWLSQLKLDTKLKIKTIDDLISLYSSKGTEDQSVNSDLGYGIGQLFPLICLLSLYNENYSLTNEELMIDFGDSYIPQFGLGNCFLIEEPEANLHPNYQSKLADIFIDAAWKFGHQFVIETHSEYMVRKFQYWVAKGKIKPSDVNIYYFDNRNDDERVNDVIIKKININSDGSLSSSFGSGFYDETDNIALGIFNLNSKNLN